MKHLLHREIYIKVALCSVVGGVPPHHFNVFAINEMVFFFYLYICKGINKLFADENKVTEHGLKLERWQGPPLIK